MAAFLFLAGAAALALCGFFALMPETRDQHATARDAEHGAALEGAAGE